jgi:mRNA interferase MazF
MTTAKRGEVVLVRFDPAEGSEVRKTRPAVVVSNAAACRFDAVLQVVPITGLRDRGLRPYEARIDSPESGLKKPSRAVANQVRTVSRGRIARRLGCLSKGERMALDRALAIQLGLNTS